MSAASPSPSAPAPSSASRAETAHRYYQPSGRVPFTGTITMLLLGVIGAFALAPLYALADCYAGVDKLRVLACGAYAALVGAWVYFCSYLGKVRSRAFAGIVGFVIGVFALYFAWTWFLCVRNDWEFAALLIDPVTLWNILPGIADRGLWEKNGQPIGAIEQMVWWSGEALTILIAATALAAQQSRPFCEECGRWTSKAAQLRMAVPTSSGLKEELEAENYEQLANLIRLPAAPNIATSATLYSCPGCDDSDYLDLLVTTTDQQNNAGSHAILKQLSIPPEVAGWIKDPSVLFRQSAEGSDGDGSTSLETPPQPAPTDA
jgi:hypothetical protein